MAGKPKFLYALYQGEGLLCAGTMKELSGIYQARHCHAEAVPYTVIQKS